MSTLKSSILVLIVLAKAVNESLPLFEIFLIVIQDFFGRWWCLTAFDINSSLNAKPVIHVFEENHQVEGSDDYTYCKQPNNYCPCPSVAFAVNLMFPDHACWSRWTHKLKPSIEKHLLGLRTNLLSDLLSKLETLHAFFFSLH